MTYQSSSKLTLQTSKLVKTLHLSDVKLPKGVTSDELAKGADHDQAVVTLNAPKGASSDEAAEEEATEE